MIDELFLYGDLKKVIKDTYLSYFKCKQLPTPTKDLVMKVAVVDSEETQFYLCVDNDGTYEWTKIFSDAAIKGADTTYFTVKDGVLKLKLSATDGVKLDGSVISANIDNKTIKLDDNGQLYSTIKADSEVGDLDGRIKVNAKAIAANSERITKLDNKVDGFEGEIYNVTERLESLATDLSKTATDVKSVDSEVKALEDRVTEDEKVISEVKYNQGTLQEEIKRATSEVYIGKVANTKADKNTLLIYDLEGKLNRKQDITHIDGGKGIRIEESTKSGEKYYKIISSQANPRFSDMDSESSPYEQPLLAEELNKLKSKDSELNVSINNVLKHADSEVATINTHLGNLDAEVAKLDSEKQDNLTAGYLVEIKDDTVSVIKSDLIKVIDSEFKPDIVRLDSEKQNKLTAGKLISIDSASVISVNTSEFASEVHKLVDSELTTIKKDIKRIDSEVSTLDSEVTIINSDIKDLKKADSELLKHIDSEIKRVDSEVSVLDKRADKTDSEIVLLKKADSELLEHIDSEIDRVEKKIDKFDSEIIKLKKTDSELSDRIDSEVSRLDSEIYRLDSEKQNKITFDKGLKYDDSDDKLSLDIDSEKMCFTADGKLTVKDLEYYTEDTTNKTANINVAGSSMVASSEGFAFGSTNSEADITWNGVALNHKYYSEDTSAETADIKIGNSTSYSLVETSNEYANIESNSSEYYVWNFVSSSYETLSAGISNNKNNNNATLDMYEGQLFLESNVTDDSTNAILNAAISADAYDGYSGIYSKYSPNDGTVDTFSTSSVETSVKGLTTAKTELSTDFYEWDASLGGQHHNSYSAVFGTDNKVNIYSHEDVSGSNHVKNSSVELDIDGVKLDVKDEDASNESTVELLEDTYTVTTPKTVEKIDEDGAAFTSTNSEANITWNGQPLNHKYYSEVEASKTATIDVKTATEDDYVKVSSAGIDTKSTNTDGSKYADINVINTSITDKVYRYDSATDTSQSNIFANDNRAKLSTSYVDSTLTSTSSVGTYYKTAQMDVSSSDTGSATQSSGSAWARVSAVPDNTYEFKAYTIHTENKSSGTEKVETNFEAGTNDTIKLLLRDTTPIANKSTEVRLYNNEILDRVSVDSITQASFSLTSEHGAFTFKNSTSYVTWNNVPLGMRYYTVSLPATTKPTSGYVDLTVTGLRADDHPIIDVVIAAGSTTVDDELSAYNNIYRVEAQANKLRVYLKDSTTTAITLSVACCGVIYG